MDGAPEGEPPSASVEAQALPVEVKAVPVGVQLPFPGLLPVQQVHQVQVWQGQFPPPDAIERYEAVLTGAFDRIMKMAERQQEATIESAVQAMTFQAHDVQRGHYLGASITLAAIVGSVIAAAFGHDKVALALVGVPVLTVAKALVDSVTVNRQVASQAKLNSDSVSGQDENTAPQ